MLDLKLFIILPLTGLIIGWLTNYIAIKLLFIPQKKVLGIQGLIPRRKQKLAEKIAQASLSILPPKIEKLSKTPIIGKQITNYIQSEISKKVSQMSNQEIQNIVENVANKELKFIQFSGAVLGLIIGIIQALILSFY